MATISLIGIIVTQIFWITSVQETQEAQINLQKTQIDIQEKEFNDRVSIALTNVAEEILTINNDPADLYEAVKQIRSNYFVVSINDTLHPYLLEAMLKREFKRRNIDENFEYGIYDCFTDSIVYGNYVAVNTDTTGAIAPPQIKWDKDGHYFGIFFPNRESYSIAIPKTSIGGWVFSSLIIFIILIFYAYSIYVILQQKKLSEIKTDFINNMTHELKTPISTISLSSEVLLKPGVENDPERIKQFAQIIFDENARLKSQVERVLQLAKLEKGTINLKRGEIDIHKIIRTSIENSQHAVKEKDGIIQSNLLATKFIIDGDEVHITNIIYNLIDNASKYSPDSPKISVTTADDKNGISITVSDNGVGISKDALKHVFDKFFRVPTGNVHDVKGFGLGLYYVKVMVEAHSGKITVNSEPGKGSSFKVWLPHK